MIGIYKITNLINGKVYIGQSIDIKRRWKDHKKIAFNKNDDCYDYPLYKAIRKYGFDNFSFEVLEKCNTDELNEKEKFYIAKYDSWKNGYNQDEGGNSATHSQKLKDNDVSAIILRLKTTKDNTKIIANDFGVSPRTIHSINIGETYHRDVEKYPIRPHLSKLIASENSKNKEIKFHKKLQAKNGTNRPNPLELAQIVKEHGFGGTGKMFGVSDNAIKKWCKNYGIPYRKKELINWYNEQMSIQPPITKNREELMKPVKQIDMKTGETINIFKSICEAGRFLGKTNNQHIGEACRGTIKSAYGYYWEYA